MILPLASGVIPLLFFSLVHPVVGGMISSSACGLTALGALKRDPFYVAHVPIEQQSRYDIASPRILGIISVEGVNGAIIRFDDKTQVVYVGDVVREHVVVAICDEVVVVVDGDRKEKRWLI